MNGKKAKALRRKAEDIIISFVKDKVLDQSLTKGLDRGRLIAVVPYRIHMREDFTKSNGIGTQRFFYRLVKKYPWVTYQDFAAKYYGESTC